MIRLGTFVFLLALEGIAMPLQEPQSLEPRIELFTPQGEVKNVRQVRVLFSHPMIPLGDPLAAEPPFLVECPEPGVGRWVDSRNWIYDFEKDLSGGLRCTFRLREGLRSLAGQQLSGPKEFVFSTGGPDIQVSHPYQGNEQINEDQVFILELDAEVEEASVLEHCYFVVGGIASRVPVRVLSTPEKQEILATQYPYRDRPDDPLLLLLQATLRFPPDSRVDLVWGRGIRARTGISRSRDQILPFRTRPKFQATFECPRENPNRKCIPLLPMRLRFSAPVPRQSILDARLKGPEGRIWSPKDPGETQWIYQLVFEGPFPEESDFVLEIPVGLQDDAGRPLSNQDHFPLVVQTDEFPPLAKFSADFGILELKAEPVLPVTVRNLEPELELQKLGIHFSLEGRVLRWPEGEPWQVVEWIRRLQERSSEDRDKSVFEGMIEPPLEQFSLPKSHGPKDLEVMGIPLPEPGFYVVELRSEVLGDSLIGPNKSMYVPAAALVTDLSVHLKWGMESSLVWVTRLHDGEPAAGVLVQIFDCTGRKLWEGTTDTRGLALVRGLPPRDQAASCSYHPLDQGLLVMAREDADMSFVHSSWQDGIEPWRFGLPQEWDAQLVSAHTILDRPLYRAGETVHMKHVLRRRTGSGFDLVPESMRPTHLSIRHLGSDQEFELPLSWDAQGLAESSWSIPKEARLGTYQLFFLGKSDSSEEHANAWLSGSFRVEEFRIPLMTGRIRLPDGPLVGVKRLALDLGVQYLAGGPAGRLPVTLRYQAQPRRMVLLEDFENFQFASGPVKEGIFRAEEAEAARRSETLPLRTQLLTLDEAGSTRLSVEDLPESSRPLTLEVEMEFQDPNGQVQTVSNQATVWPAAWLVGIRPDSWAFSQEQLRFAVAVVDVAGKAIEGAQVEVEAFLKKTYSHRKRLVGGFYAYQHVVEVERVGNLCRGTTDSRGILGCQVPAPAAGNLILQARVEDPAGKPSFAQREVWVAGEQEWWFAAEDHDRMDLIPEKPRYEPGQTATFQVRMPFRRATALITVEREGISEVYVKRLSGTAPVVRIPIGSHHAPNVYVSVLAVRGRVAGIQPTATVDLGRPAYKLGIAGIRVGWGAHELKVRVKTDREVYRVREKVKVDIEVKTRDGKRPPPGTELALAAVDEGLLELLPNPSWQVLEAMMAPRAYGVSTATAQMNVVGRRHFGLKAQPQGGGGGKQRTRELFDTLLLWKARLPVDGRGRASLEVPLNDSLTRFRIVAVAVGGVDRFGTGSASIRSTQDLMIFSGIPPLVREGDHFLARFTLRNATDSPQKGEVSALVSPLPGALESLPFSLTPGESRQLQWEVTVPGGVDRLIYRIRAAGPKGLKDELRVEQRVVPSVPVRVTQATLVQLERSLEAVVRRPANALDGVGGLHVTLSPSLLSGLASARAYMESYPYACLEQMISRAVALHDEAGWRLLMRDLPAYLDEDGLAKYFPSQPSGSEVLSAYLVAVAHERGWRIPSMALERLLEGLSGFVEGRILRSSALPTADLAMRKMGAIEALSRYGRATPSHLSTLSIEPNLWPTSTLIDWWNVLHRVAEIPNREVERRRAEQILRSRLYFQGTVMGFSTESRDGLWWLMVSNDVNAVRLILSLLEFEVWREELGRMVRAAMARQRNGRWDLTTANAWGVVAIEKFAQKLEREPVTGLTAIRLEDQELQLQWEESPQGGERAFEWPGGDGRLRLLHQGSGRPWVLIQSRAAIARQEPSWAGYRIEKSLQAVQQRQSGTWSVGDVIRVQLRIEAQGDMSWVVLEDPIPAGASILGTGLGRDSSLLSRDENRGFRRATFVERSFEAFRAYYEFAPKGNWIVEYTLRINNPGVFRLPPTRVEALYAPEMFGELPNSPFEVRP